MRRQSELRVKICGIMRSSDAKVAVDCGADAVGFVVGSPASPRNLTLANARRLMKAVPVFTTKVAVTASADTRNVLKICSKLRPGAIQLHWYKPELVRLVRAQHPETQLIIATAIRGEASVESAFKIAAHSDAVLADSPSISGLGGTGRVHDWKMTAKVRNRIYPHPLILAGGLTPGNVRHAIRSVRPFGVDVSTGVEKKIGVKDQHKIRAFIRKAKGTTI